MKNRFIKMAAVFFAVAFIISPIIVSFVSSGSSDNPATPTDLDPDTGTITLRKHLVGDIWHIRCDYMDGETFHAGGGIWKRDLIMNPSGNLSREGHRSNKCGNDDNWVIWVGEDGVPYRMDEIKSGATGGTLPTRIYSPRYDLSSNEIYSMSVDDTDLIWRYSQNFIDTMGWSDIKIGQRLYWTTENKGQIWYHTGIPYKSTPTFMLFVDGVGYPLVSGEYVEISDLMPGIHEITESADAQYYLGEITSSSTIEDRDEWSIVISVGDGENVSVEWNNVVNSPPPATAPPAPDPPVVITPTPTPTATPTETPTSEPTATPTATHQPSITPTATPTDIPEITDVPTAPPTIVPTHTPEPTATYTSIPTTAPTNSPTPIITLPPTHIPVTQTPFAPTPVPTPDSTPTMTPAVTETIAPTPSTTHAPSETQIPHETIMNPPIPELPPEYKKPAIPHRPFTDMIDEYLTALGISIGINHIGDSFD